VLLATPSVVALDPITGGGYIPGTKSFTNPGRTMRADIAKTVDDIEQALSLLRRHL